MTVSDLPPQWQLIYFGLTFFGWPIVLLLLNARGRGFWMFRRDVDEREKALHEHYQTVIAAKDQIIAELREQSNKRVAELDTLWRERFKEMEGSRDQWRSGAQNLTGLTERIIESVERGMLTVIQTISRTVEEAIAEAYRKRKP